MMCRTQGGIATDIILGTGAEKTEHCEILALKARL